MTSVRKQIARQYVHDIINSFAKDPNSGNYYENYDPPNVSFYLPVIERLLKIACHEDKYSVCHRQFSVLHDPDNEIYDINGHRVFVINGTIDNYIDGVVYDQNESREGKAKPPPKQRCCPPYQVEHGIQGCQGCQG